jgi:hypothetical protein
VKFSRFGATYPAKQASSQLPKVEGRFRGFMGLTEAKLYHKNS